jgi:4-amino-4-deoxy-L-arabinose transferase-like glycosyltransferase
MSSAPLEESSLVFSSRQENSLKSLLRSPAAAVVAAYLLRMAIFYWLHRGGENAHSELYPLGREEGVVAWLLASGRGFSAFLVGIHGPTAWFAPGYPFLLALGFKIFRMDNYAVLLFGQALNCAFSALTCWPIYAIAKKLFNANIALASCWFWVVLPPAVLFPLEWVWDQSLSAFLLAMLIYTTLALRDSSRALAWAGYGLLWAVAALTNPAVASLFPFLLIWLGVARRKNSAPWLRLAATAVLVIILGLVPWTVRNYRAFGAFVPVKSNFGLELWLGNNSQVDIVWAYWRHPAADPGEKQELQRLGEVRYMQEKQRQAIAFITSHPRLFIRSCFDRFADTWTGLWDSRVDQWVKALRVRAAYEWFSGAFSLLALAGLLFARRAAGPGAMPLVLAVLIFPATYYLTHSAMHYRHPIDPVLNIFAVYAVARAYSAVAVRFKTRQAVSLSLPANAQ